MGTRGTLWGSEERERVYEVGWREGEWVWFCFVSLFFLKKTSEREVDGMYRFDSVQSAMRCIAKLRERRDLHPSFSKVRFGFLFYFFSLSVFIINLDA